MANIPLATWPQKLSSEINIENPIQKFIKRTFDDSDMEQTKIACKEMDELRRISVNKALDANQKATETIARYHDQLVMLMGKVPLLDNGVAINWNWKDAFDSRKQVSSQSGYWEQACVLYNLAAIKNAVASQCNLSDEDQQKQAMKYLQEAAGIIDHLASTVIKIMHQERLTKDLQPASLRAFSTVCVAQAQEILVNSKRVQTSMSEKPQMQSKLARQASILFSDAVQQLKAAAASPQGAIEMCEAKHNYYEAMAQNFAGLTQSKAAEHGTAIGHYKKCLAHCKTAKGLAKKGKMSGLEQAINRLVASAEKICAETEKDNNWIYHQKVVSEVPSLPNQPLAKPTPFKGTVSAQPITDMFSHLVSLPVQQALTAFETRRKACISTKLAGINNLNQLLDAVIGSLNIDQTLDSIFKNSASTLPPSISAAAQHVRSTGGVRNLDALRQQLAPAMQRNEEILKDCQSSLDSEQAADENYRVQYGVEKNDTAKWPRKTSNELNFAMAKEIAQYRSILENAKIADNTVDSKLQSNRQGIEILSGSDGDIAGYIGPGGGGDTALARLASDPVANELKEYREQARALKAVREVMEHQLRNEYALDMTTKFVAAQAENQFIDEEALSNAALIELFQPMDNQIKEQTDAQDTVARNLERCAQQIGTCKGSSDASDIQRSQKINILTSASSAYQELTKHLQEGTKFYNDLTDRLVKTQSQINDFVTSRKLEADELCKSMGNVSISQSPSVTSTSSAAPPARPPPPSFKENQQPPVAAPRTSVSSTTPSQPNLPNYQNVQPQATYPPQQQFQNMATAPVYRPPQPGAPPQQQPGGYPMPYPVYQPGVVPGYPMQGGYPMQQFPPQGYPQQQHPGMNPYQGYPQQGFPPNQQPPPQ